MIARENIHLGDTVRIRNGETIVVEGVWDSYGDRDGEHPGPWVSTGHGHGRDRYLLADVTEVVERNPRICRFCGEGVTSTNPETTFCRNCFYNGTAAEDQNAAVIDQFREVFEPLGFVVSIDHTGGGCFWLYVGRGFGEVGPYWVATDGEASIPRFDEGESWGIVCRFEEDEDGEGEVVIEADEKEDGLPLPTPGIETQKVIDVILADMVARGVVS